MAGHVPILRMQCCIMPLLLLAAIANDGVRLSVQTRVPGADVIEHKRVTLKMPCRSWFHDRLQVHGVSLSDSPLGQSGHSNAGVCLVGVASVSAGKEFRGPLTEAWCCELRLLQEYYAHAEDAYSLNIEEVWALSSSIEIDFRRSAKGETGIAVLSQQHALYIPVLSAADLLTECQRVGEEAPACTLKGLLQQSGLAEGLGLRRVG